MSYCEINTEEYFLDIHDPALFRSGRPDILHKIDVPKNLAKPAEKHLGGSPPTKLQAPARSPTKRDPSTSAPHEYCETPKSSPFHSPFRPVFQNQLPEGVKKYSEKIFKIPRRIPMSESPFDKVAC